MKNGGGKERIKGKRKEMRRGKMGDNERFRWKSNNREIKKKETRKKIKKNKREKKTTKNIHTK